MTANELLAAEILNRALNEFRCPFCGQLEGAHHHRECTVTIVRRPYLLREDPNPDGVSLTNIAHPDDLIIPRIARAIKDGKLSEKNRK